MNLRSHKRNIISRQFQSVMLLSMCRQIEAAAFRPPVNMFELFPELAPIVHPVDGSNQSDFDAKAWLAERRMPDLTNKFVLKRKKDDAVFGEYDTEAEALEQIQKAKAGKKAALYLA